MLNWIQIINSWPQTGNGRLCGGVDILIFKKCVLFIGMCQSISLIIFLRQIDPWFISVAGDITIGFLYV